MKKKLYLILIFIFLIIIMINISAFAHKVNIFAYVEEGQIYTESYFSDGKKCVESKIEVFDNQGNKLLEGLTDKEGMFSFKIPSENVIEGDLKLVLTASMGHRAEYVLELDVPEEEFPISEIETKEEISEEIFNGKIASYISKEEIRLLINEALDKKLTPIMREIKKSRENNISFSEIIGGIGYIFGIFGIIAYFLSRKKY